MRSAVALLRQRDRIDDERRDADGRIDDAIDERAVRAVLEQPAHEVREQRLVRAHGRVDAAGAIELVLADDLVVDALAHAVQALELVGLRAGERVDRRDRERVVRRELRIDRVGRGEHRLGAREIAHVRVHLAREDRIAGEAVHLGALDLAVPVRALREPHHQATAMPPRERDEPVDHVPCALLVRLDDEAQARPARERRRGGERLEDVEREVEPVGLLRVHREADVVLPRELRQRQDARHELVAHALALAPANSADAAPKA